MKKFFLAIFLLFSPSIALAQSGVVFGPSPDHNNPVLTGYRVRIYQGIGTTSMLQERELGKPAPNAQNEIVYLDPSLFSGLANGNYEAAAVAYGPGGTSEVRTGFSVSTTAPPPPPPPPAPQPPPGIEIINNPPPPNSTITDAWWGAKKFVSVFGGQIRKTGAGADATDFDAGSVSTNALVGDGSVEFTLDLLSSAMMGFGSDFANRGASITHVISFSPSGYVGLYDRQAAKWIAEMRCNVGDTFKIERVAGVVSVYRNGQLIPMSSPFTALTASTKFAVVLREMNSGITVTKSSIQ